MLTPTALLSLLQFASPGLPVGAYSYSEGLETLVEREIVSDRHSLAEWIEWELRGGTIRVDAAVMLRSHRSFARGDIAQLQYWNAWLSAARETEELREQSWQMGNSLLQLLFAMLPEKLPELPEIFAETPCNFAIAFGMAAVAEQIPEETAAIGYLHSWASNLITAGVKLIPLGQTAGQQLLLNLQPMLIASTQEILALEDNNLSSCSWGLSLASMQHETLYSRLFRS
jgi:urease accessory protein